jgi:hypothetical protein
VIAMPCTVVVPVEFLLSLNSPGVGVGHGPTVIFRNKHAVLLRA